MKNPEGYQKSSQEGMVRYVAEGERSVFPHLRPAFDVRDAGLSAGGVADEWVTQLLRQGDAKVFKKYSQMKLQMKREALQKMNRQANEGDRVLTRKGQLMGFCHGFATVGPVLSSFVPRRGVRRIGKWFRIKRTSLRARSSAG